MGNWLEKNLYLFTTEIAFCIQFTICPLVCFCIVACGNWCVLLRLCSAHPCLVIGLLPLSSYVYCFRLEINTLKTNTTWETAAASDPAPAASSGGFKVQQQLWASRAAGEYKPTGENCGSNEGAVEKSPWWRNLSISCKFRWFVIHVALSVNQPRNFLSGLRI